MMKKKKFFYVNQKYQVKILSSETLYSENYCY